MAMRITADEALGLARRYEESGGLETTRGDFLRPRVRDELNHIARRAADRSVRGFVIALRGLVIVMWIVLILILVLPVPVATKYDVGIPLFATFGALSLSLVLCNMSPMTERYSGHDYSGHDDDGSDEDYGKLLAAYRMLGGDESQLEPYVGIDAAERVASKFSERPAGAAPSSSPDCDA